MSTPASTAPHERAAPADEPRRWDLPALLAHRHWVRRSLPFPHVVAQNVFVPSFYAQLHDEFRRVLREHPEGFARGLPGYDAGIAAVAAHRDGPLGIFVSREWHDLLEGVAGVHATGDVSAALHHHDAGSRRGWPHNDLNPGWFGGPPPAPDVVRLESHDGVQYGQGTRPDGVSARETVRAVSLLFYLGNGDWQPGDGGETGLFRSYDDAAGVGAAAAVPPVDNSLVLFECTAFSLHSFLGTQKDRNSVVMWLHRDKSEVLTRWGEHSIVYW